MTSTEGAVEFIPTLQRWCPPTKFHYKEDGEDVYMWYITEDEYLRLSKLFGRDFQETGLGATLVIGLPSPCHGCGKYSEFIDWVWTALWRGVHSRDFMFKALKESRQGRENTHDVYCSECGVLTNRRSRNNAEGGAPNIFVAGPLVRSKLPRDPTNGQNRKAEQKPSKTVVWGKWWLDNSGKYIGARRGG